MSNVIQDVGGAWNGDTIRLRFPITDQDNVGFKPEALTVTVKDEDRGTVIKSATDILASCDAGGIVTYDAPTSDTTTIGTQLTTPVASHLFIFRWTWNAGADAKTEVARVKVKPV